MLGKFQRSCRISINKGKLIAQYLFEVELFFQPAWHGFQKRRKPAWCESQVGFKQSLEGQQWFFIEDHCIDVTERRAGVT